MVDPAVPPERDRPAVLPLRGDGGTTWHGVSRRLITVRSVALAAVAGPLLIGSVCMALVAWPWAWAVTALVVLVWLLGQWAVVLQVPAITWAELPEELAIRRGRLWRSMVTIPYGRIQYVDLESGPLMRWQDLAKVTVNTASPASSGEVPGLPAPVAEDLRARLAARGEAQRAGL